MEVPEITSAVEIVELLVRHAYALRASDVHLEPYESFLLARTRVDGLLQDTYQFPIRLHPEVLARLKILSGLRTDEHQAPQDGRFRFSLDSEKSAIDVRVSIAPTYYGENAVLRLLSSRDSLQTLESLGLGDAHQATIMRALTRPHGLILITGPTGSGKTSTLYVLLQLLNVRNASLVTIEDPIEHSIDGVTQIQANQQSGLSFADGLRSVLRQDPDVIGIGEIRDIETASLAVHASLTGHMVLSTLHTTNAPTALPRLIDLGIEPYLLASTITIVIGQRLVSRLCQHCKGKGCKSCNKKGVSGRIGIFEVLSIDDALREAIGRKASSRELLMLAEQQGMASLLVDGLEKAANGLVSADKISALGPE